MSGINKVILIGNLGRDPEVYTFDNGNKKVRLAIATTEVYRNKQNERIEHTEWHIVVLFRGLAEVAAKYLQKGSQVYVEGRLRTRSWEENGSKHYVTEIEAQNLTMLGSKRNENPSVLQGVEALPRVPEKLENEPEYNPENDPNPF